MASSIYRLGNLSPQAVAWTLFSLPLVAGMFYILSAKIGIIGCRPRGYMNETRCRLLYVFTEILMGVIVLTYAWELSCLSLVPFLRTVINWVEGTVYLLGSVIFWCILLFVFLKARGVLRISLGGCALLYLVPELFLLTSSVYPTQVGKIMAKFLMSIRATRFVTLVLLLCVIIGSCTVPCHREPDLEATASLIPNGHACRDVVHNKQVKSINYGATTQESDHSQSNLLCGLPSCVTIPKPGRGTKVKCNIFSSSTILQISVCMASNHSEGVSGSLTHPNSFLFRSNASPCSRSSVSKTWA